MKLEGLPRGQAERLTAIGTPERVKLEPLSRAANAAGQPHAHHERKGWFQLLPAPFVPQVTVILLIETVKLHQLGIRRPGNRARDLLEKPRGDGAAQLIAACLEPLVRAEPFERLGKVVAAIGRRIGRAHWTPQY